MANRLGRSRRPASALIALLVTVFPPAVERTQRTDAGSQSRVLDVAPRLEGNVGIIRGRITDAESGAPVSGAEISASCCGGSGAIRSTADADGRYEVTVSAPGEYIVTAKAPTYVHTAFGQASLTNIVAADDTLAVQVRVRAGHVTSNVDIRLQPSAEVGGRIFGEAGEPLADVEVELLREMYQPGGVAPVPVAFGTIERVTAEKTMSGAQYGTYRISGLPPGRYFARAYATESVVPTVSGGAEAYAPTFFPAASRISDSQPIVLAAGQKISNLDFRLLAVKTHVVSGRLVKQKGGALPEGLSVELVPGGPGSEVERPRATVTADGRFEIDGVVAGDYMLAVVNRTGRDQWLGVRRPIAVLTDVRNLKIVNAQGTRVEGRFVQDDGAPLQFDPRGIQVALDYEESPDTAVRDLTIEAQVAPDGTFALEGPAGRAAFRVSRPSGAHLAFPSAVIKRVLLDGTDVTDAPIDLLPGAPRRIEIVVTNRAAVVAGTVSDEREQPAAYALVITLPNDRRRLRASRLIRAAFADRDGGYEIGALPPADYRVVTVRSLPRDAWKDPVVLERLWSTSIPLRLREGEHRTLALRLSPALVLGENRAATR
jgi:hypothetical protein